MSFCDMGNRGHEMEISAIKRVVKKICFDPNFNFILSIPHITKTHKNDTMVKYLSNGV